MTKHVQHVANTVGVNTLKIIAEMVQRKNPIHPGEKSQSGDESRRKPSEDEEAQDPQEEAE